MIEKWWLCEGWKVGVEEWGEEYEKGGTRVVEDEQHAELSEETAEARFVRREEGWQEPSCGGEFRHKATGFPVILCFEPASLTPRGDVKEDEKEDDEVASGWWLEELVWCWPE
jgi:hypothetical protein